MTASYIPAIVLGMGLSTLSVVASAQTGEKTDVAPAAPAAASTTNTGQVSDPGWTGATEPPAAPVSAVPSANQSAAPSASVPAQSTTTSARSDLQGTSSGTATTSIETMPPPDEPVTLFGHGNVKFGGYGSIGARYARLRGEDTALVGLEGALLIDHRLAVGFAAYGSSNEHRLASGNGFDRPFMHFGYGGFLMRYHAFIPRSPVSISFAALVGGGGVGLTDRWDDDVRRDNADVFFIFEPQLGAHLNVTRWMRVGVDAGYRLVSGIGRFGFTEADFRGASVGGSVGFGWF